MFNYGKFAMLSAEGLRERADSKYTAKIQSWRLNGGSEIIDTPMQSKRVCIRLIEVLRSLFIKSEIHVGEI